MIQNAAVQLNIEQTSTSGFIFRSNKQSLFRRTYNTFDSMRPRCYLVCVCCLMAGGGAFAPGNSWTYLPGLQFILAGLVGKTAAFFGVPAMRLALDVVVYFGVITVFVTKVMVLKEAGTVTPWEFLWLGYLLGAVGQQVGVFSRAFLFLRH